MKNFASLALSLGLLLLTGCQSTRIHSGNRHDRTARRELPVVTRTLEHPAAFERIDVSNGMEVEYAHSNDGTTSITICGPEDRIERVHVTNRAGKLSIGYRTDCPSRETGPNRLCKVIATSPDLHAATVDMGGTLSISTPLQTDRFTARVTSGATLYMQDLDCGTCTIELQNAGGLQGADLQCEALRVEISNGSECRMEDISCTDGGMYIQSAGFFDCGNFTCGDFSFDLHSGSDLKMADLHSTGNLLVEIGNASSLKAARIDCIDYSASVSSGSNHTGNGLRCQRFSAIVTQASRFNCPDLTVAESTYVRSSGGSAVTLSGHTDKARYSCTGVSEIHASKLIASDVIAEAQSASRINCHAETSLDASVVGMSHIYYSGKPQHTRFSDPQSGIISR